MITDTQTAVTRKTLKSEIRIERLLGHKFKASIGPAQGVAKSEREARAICEEQIVDVLSERREVCIEVRGAYLVVWQVESSESAWYTIKRLNGIQQGRIFPLCCMSPKGLKAAIESHLAQYMADDTET